MLCFGTGSSAEARRARADAAAAAAKRSRPPTKTSANPKAASKASGAGAGKGAASKAAKAQSPEEDVGVASGAREGRAGASGMPAYAAFEALLDEYWASSLKLSPENATMMGYHADDDKLSEQTEAEYARVRALCEATLSRVDREFKASALRAWSLDQRTTLLVLRESLEEQMGMIDNRVYLMQISTLSAPHTSLPHVIEKNRVESEADLRALLSRLRQVPRYLEQVVQLTRLGVEQGVCQSRVVLASVPGQVAAMCAAGARQDPFSRFVIESCRGKAAWAALEQELLLCVAQDVMPALARYGEALGALCARLSDEPSLPKRLGPSGERLYRFLLESHTSSKMSPEEVHALGRAEVARISAEMEAIAKGAGFASVEAYQRHIDEVCVVRSEEELVAHYQVVSMNILPQLPRLLGRLPRTTFGIRPIPAYAAKAAPGAYYQPPPIDLVHPGWFSLNTSGLRDRKTYVAESLVAHEAVPGHHLQIALALENDKLHAFRRFTFHTAYIEGWALYAEYLGYELGLYKDPASHYGRLVNEQLRACRLVVDTGMNFLGWSRDDAIQFMLENRAGTLQDIESETTRYLGMPGQACAYKVGELVIKRLRKRAQDALGAKFDVRAFHDLVLALGSVPMTTLEEVVVDWIDEQRK